MTTNNETSKRPRGRPPRAKTDSATPVASSMTETAQAAIKAAQESAAEWVDLDRLHGWDKNPKRHPDAQVKDIMRSIRRFGWGAVILARPNGEIIAGHGRMEAAKRLGLTRVPVRWLDLDPTEAHLLALADNKLTEIGEWDGLLVSRILKDAKNEGADLDGLGWDEQEINKFLSATESIDLDAAFGALPDGAPEMMVRRFMFSEDEAAIFDDRLAAIIKKYGIVRGERQSSQAILRCLEDA